MRLPTTPVRTPLESREPIVGFSVIRAAIACAAVAALVILGFPYHGEVTAVIIGAALPWSLLVLLITRHSLEAGLNPLIALGDMAVLGLLMAVEPEMYVPTHFVAIFLVAAHAHFQGTAWSLVVGSFAPLVLVPVTLASNIDIQHGLLQAYEVIFAVACLATAVVVGALREAESSARLRARELSRRTIGTESSLRRRLAEEIHDGPLQELSSVELMLASAEQALDRGDDATARAVLTEARSLTRSNVSFLRNEIVELGPHAFEEVSFEQAVSECIELWERRFGVSVKTEINDRGLDPEVAGPLFRITQEAVANAGKHADASTIVLRVKREQGLATLEVEDDGRGFGNVDPLGSSQPGHIGLASMRERAEMLGGELAIDSSDSGTCVRIRVPV
jgi:signal transduction histidine kinase